MWRWSQISQQKSDLREVTFDKNVKVRSLVVCRSITSPYICAVSHAAMDVSIAETSSADVIVSKPGRLI